MKKLAKLKKLCSRPMQIRFLAASEEERKALRSVIEDEAQWVIRKMERKGFQLEATVCEVYGVFTRGAAKGTLCQPSSLQDAAS